ncbi:DUF6717 family protein [Mucilaginibacter celer]|uniref:Uncharacterized protein n=1 Tax=Mucilaginibacter celer TaxID=2305508 RepID=A0A494VIG0_9SPHI|nr:DUF6717 family protein [Mucilaginibacter celer]AYL94666.1 hypothetical protein HYN43_004850 [Mucilaginibacter celer]
MTTDINTYKFVKETGRWYIDLPDWPGVKADLEMVEGADIMLDYVGEGSDVVELMLSETLFDGSSTLKLIEDYAEHVGGGIYLLDEYNGVTLNQQMWLCDVTKYVFGGLPESIYFRKVS